jgi:flagellar capping protein FliD
MATNPTNNDTISINGVTFTFKSTLGTNPGNIKICSSVAKTIANFVNAFNTPGTSISEATDAGFVAFSAADQAKLKNITATNGTTYITLVAKG